jgi:hypothetical protein
LADLLEGLLAFVTLIAAGIGSLFLAIELITAASGHVARPWGILPLPASHSGRIVALLAIMLVLLVLLAFESRRRPVVLAVPVDDGSVRIAADALAKVVASELARHPDVLDTHCRVAVIGGGLRADLRVAARPLADPIALEREVRALAQGSLERGTGLHTTVRRLSVSVVSVRGLARYL